MFNTILLNIFNIIIIFAHHHNHRPSINHIQLNIYFLLPTAEELHYPPPPPPPYIHLCYVYVKVYGRTHCIYCTKHTNPRAFVTNTSPTRSLFWKLGNTSKRLGTLKSSTCFYHVHVEQCHGKKTRKVHTKSNKYGNLISV